MNSEIPGDLMDRARNRQVTIRGHFSAPVRIEDVEPIGDGWVLLRVRTATGQPAETTLTAADLEQALATATARAATVPPEQLFRWIESHRIRLAYAHDPYFAVSLSGVRGLPHQVEAVYRSLLPQPLLRFVLADDPGAGKTIMTGLLIKELKLRGVADRTLVVAPAPLTIQWQDEMLERFDERFEVVSAHQVRWQLGGNPWQRHNQVITSLDFAKRDEVMPDLLRADWDLVVIDEAHKCSAWTDGEETKRTKRYRLAEELSRRTARLLLLTATPHSGDEDRFTHFLALLDPDQFASADLVKRQIALPNSPYFLRRQKEDLLDEHGHKLFVERRVSTQPFTLSEPELRLYEAVTTYINTFLGAGRGSRASAVALARTVLQRRLASSLGAIHSSLDRRAERLNTRLEELESLPPDRRVKRLEELRLIDVDDDEVGDEDAEEQALETAAIEVTAARHLDELRTEIAELKKLSREASAVMAMGEERKLAALRECLQRSELAEIQDGRAKLLIFTEHRDTLEYLLKHLVDWGYTVCSIHGGHAPTDRKRIQQEFHESKQICVATEAAGEGINLQFCHLMINYDLPWNPVRLEQRMGRIHRIGQESEVLVFNFCATNTVEGQLLDALTRKLETMRAALQGRVYDVIGDILAINGLDFERLLRDTLANPKRREASLDEIQALSADKLKRYEEAVGIAQATRNIDLSWVRRHDWQSEERRLMPEYVERFFLDAAEAVKLRVEQRADGLYRVEHVLGRLRGDDLPSVRRLGRPEPAYRKLTFHKEDRDRGEHEDAVLLSPGHPLFAAVAETLQRQLEEAGVPEGAATFVDPSTRGPYHIHFLTFEVLAESAGGEARPAYGELVAVIEEAGGELHLAPNDVLHDLTPRPTAAEPPADDDVRRVTNWVRAQVQSASTTEQREERLGQADLRSAYLREAVEAHRHSLQDRWTEYDQRVYQGEEQYRVLRDAMEHQLADLGRREEAKLEEFRRLGVVRPGPIAYLGRAVVLPPEQPDDPEIGPLRADPAVELAAMNYVMAWERAQGREPEDVSSARDGSGFDIRSLEGDQVRRIEVKGRSAPVGDVGLYRTEWYAAQRFRAGYWLYVVYNAGTGTERLVTIQDPWGVLRNVQEVSQVTGYRVPAASIEAAADR